MDLRGVKEGEGMLVRRKSFGGGEKKERGGILRILFSIVPLTDDCSWSARR